MAEVLYMTPEKIIFVLNNNGTARRAWGSRGTGRSCSYSLTGQWPFSAV